LLVGITFPSVSAGIESVRLASAADSVSTFLGGAANRADRRQEVVEIEILRNQRTLRLRSARPGFEKVLELPDGVEFRRVLPPPREENPNARRFMVYPGGTVPQIAVELANRRGGRRLIRLDPVTGVPQIERPQQNQEKRETERQTPKGIYAP
jgi:hypothetical protein